MEKNTNNNEITNNEVTLEQFQEIAKNSVKSAKTSEKKESKPSAKKSAKSPKTAPKSAKKESAKKSTSAKKESVKEVKTITKYEVYHDDFTKQIEDTFKDIEGVSIHEVKGRRGRAIKKGNKRIFEVYFTKSNAMQLCIRDTSTFEKFDKALNGKRKNRIELNHVFHANWDMKEDIKGLNTKDFKTITSALKATLKAF